MQSPNPYTIYFAVWPKGGCKKNQNYDNKSLHDWKSFTLYNYLPTHLKKGGVTLKIAVWELAKRCETNLCLKACKGS